MTIFLMVWAGERRVGWHWEGSGRPIAGLLYDLHRETAENRRDLIWTLDQLPWTAAKTTSHEEIPCEVSESRLRKGKGAEPWDTGRWTGSSEN